MMIMVIYTNVQLYILHTDMDYSYLFTNATNGYHDFTD